MAAYTALQPLQQKRLPSLSIAPRSGSESPQ
jgi:hypothetical protein